ncbi:hypothetical protein QQS21_011725, partial [Conoideocrella luteorostrata]
NKVIVTRDVIFDKACIFEDKLPDRELMHSIDELIEKVGIPEGLQGLEDELAAENIDEIESTISHTDESESDVQDEIVVNTGQSQENSAASECDDFNDDSDEGYRTESEVS